MGLNFISGDLARAMQSVTKTRGMDSAEVAEDIGSLREVAARVIAVREHGWTGDVPNPVAIFMGKPTSMADAEKAKGTLTQNRANAFRKAMKVAGLLETTKDTPNQHVKLSRTSPKPEVLVARMTWTEEQLAELEPPFCYAPWGHILIEFSESGLDMLVTWARTQDKVPGLVAKLLAGEEISGKDEPSDTDDDTDDDDEPAVDTTPVEEIAPARGRRAS